LIGKWSIKSKSWKKLDQKIKKKYNLVLKKTGEFYMSFDDFIQNFEYLTVAHVNKSAFMALDENGVSFIDTKWNLKNFFGSWKERFNAGSENFTFYENNAQYYLKIDSSSDICSLVIALMQPYSAEVRKENNGEYFTYTTMIHIYRVIVNQESIDSHLKKGEKFSFEDLKICFKAKEDILCRELTKRCYLEVGSYVVVASVYEEHADTKYLLRFLHDNSTCALIEKLE